MFRIRMVRMDIANQLQYYIPTAGHEHVFSASELKPLMPTALVELATALFTSLFLQSTDLAVRISESFIFEMQMFLHPQLKLLDVTTGKIIKFCNVQKRFTPDSCRRIAEGVK